LPPVKLEVQAKPASELAGQANKRASELAGQANNQRQTAELSVKLKETKATINGEPLK
jgi:hypothetical protein